MTLTSPGSHTHTHTHVVGGFGFCFLKNTYIKNKKKDISETEGGGEETSLMSGLAGRGGRGQTTGRGWGSREERGPEGRVRGGHSQCMSRSCSYSMKA